MNSTDVSCPHCDANSFQLDRMLFASKNFNVICDAYPLKAGHILIIPKQHTACMGALSIELFEEYKVVYKKCHEFIKNTFGSVASFEHGVIGQTIFHAHTHLLPFDLGITVVVPEKTAVKQINDLHSLVDIYAKEYKYLFVSVLNKMYVVDSVLGYPRIFRDRFAAAIGDPMRGNWREMQKSKTVMNNVEQEIVSVQKYWKKYSKNNK